MSTVALIGADGAGKTSIANCLLASYPQPMKYLYMGMNPHSSNVVLPTSRLGMWLKVRAYRKKNKGATKQEGELSLHQLDSRQDKRGKLGATARLLNRLAEEWYRQLVSWIWQLQGNIVLYDRHFIIDFSAKDVAAHQGKRLTEQINLWILRHLYPEPDLVLFLDAPAEVLYARKQEVPVDYLAQYRAKLMRQGGLMKNFVVIDATQSLDKVYEDIERVIKKQVTGNR